MGVTGTSYLLIRRRVLARLSNINREAQRILEGDFSATLVDASADEIGVLAKGMNNLSDGLKQKADFARSIGTGKLAAEYKPSSEKDTLGHSLIEMRDSLKKVAQEDAKRQWTTEGLAKFSQTLRTHNSLQELADRVVADLVKYLNANQGGLFLVNGEDHNELRLELLSCYAYNRKKYQEKSIHPGQGLVGQAYLEGEKIYLTDIPHNYLSITSGLGEANPTALLIVPLKVNEKIEGVLEVASFHSLAAHQISFVEKLGENIASALASVKINARTTRLLEESRLQSEAMGAQEEEMRQNLEELYATQEEMRRKNEVMEGLLEGAQQKEMEMQAQEKMMRQSMAEAAKLQGELYAKDGQQRREIEQLQAAHQAKEKELEELLREMKINEQDLQQNEDRFRKVLLQLQQQEAELKQKNAIIHQLQQRTQQ
jgi:HAMP domain-containing protein